MPSLVSYDKNLISIDPTNLPVSTNIAGVDVTTVQARGGATIVRYATQNPGGVLITIVGSDGAPLPAGTLITDNRLRSWPIAEDGQAYLPGIQHGRQKLTAVYGATRCEFTVTVPSDMVEMPP